MARVLVPVLEYGIVDERAQHLERLGPLTCLLEGLLGLLEPVCSDQPLRVRQVDLGSQLRMLLDELEGLIPLAVVHLQGEQPLDVAQLEEDVLGVPDRGGLLDAGCLLELAHETTHLERAPERDGRGRRRGRGFLGRLAQVCEARAQLGSLRLRVERLGHVGKLVVPALPAKDVNRLNDLARRDVGLVRDGGVVGLLRPPRLPLDELLRGLGAG